MRKFISILSAAALASSVIVPLAVHAEGETVLYSDSMNGYETSAKTAAGTVFAVVSAGAYDSVAGNPDWQWIFDSPESQQLDKLTVGFEGGRGDDTAAIMIKEKEDAADKYVSLPKNRFPSRVKPQISGFDQYTANDGEDLVIAFDLKLSSDEAVLSVDNIGSITTTEAGTDWVKVKIVTSDGSTTMYVNDIAVGDAVSNTVSVIKPQPQDSDGKLDPYPTVDIDNIVILSAADGIAAVIPDAETHTPEVATEKPTLPPAAKIDNEVKFDFESDATSITPDTHKDYTTATVVDGTNGSKVMQLAMTSGKNNNYAYAKFDLSPYTALKSHVILDYDVYFSADGRVWALVGDTGSTGYNSGGYFSQGLGGSNAANAVIGEWIHTTVDMDFAVGAGTWKVTKADGTEAYSGVIETEATAMNILEVTSWSPNTSFIDNIKIQTGGSMELEVATPEPAATAEGSGIDLATDAREKLGTFEAAHDSIATVLNHSDAYKTKTTESNTAINAYSANARGNSIYVAYDVNVSKGAAISVTPYGDSGKAQASSLTLEGKADGTINITIPQNSSTTHTIKNDLVCGTWYRVVMEIQQNGTAETGTTAGALKYNVYRIDAEDQTKSIAAVEADGYARGLDKMGVTSVGVAVTGDIYIDNGVVYLAAQSSNGGGEEPTPGIATPEPAGTDEGSGIDLLPADATKFADFSAAEGAAETMLNHENAKPAVDAASISIYDANANIRGKSVYAAYDVLVNAGDKLVMKAMNKTDLGTQFVLEGKADGTVDVYAYVNKGDKVNIAGNLVCGTWYRVVIEIPQNNNDGATNTGDARYTIYRINPTDSTKTAGIAAQASGLTPRNLSGKAATDLVTEVTGTPYIDNGVTYLMTRSDNIWYRYHFTSVDGVKTVSSIEQIPADDLSKKSDKIGREYYIWNTYMQPYVPTTAEETTPEVTE